MAGLFAGRRKSHIMEDTSMKYGKPIMFLATLSLLTIPVMADNDHKTPERDFRADLRGRQEVPLTLSGGRGTLELTVNHDDTSVHFKLEYSGLLTPVSVAHPCRATERQRRGHGLFLRHRPGWFSCQSGVPGERNGRR